MSVIFIILVALMIIFSVALIAIILMQSKNAGGISGAIGGMGGSSTYWDKNKGRTIEGKLALYTRIIATIYFILAFILCIVK